MSEPALDLRRSAQIVRQRKILVGAVAALGLLAGTGYAALHPPMFTGDAVVLLSPSVHNVDTQVIIASSDPVLAGALGSVKPGMSVETLRSRIQVKHVTSNGLSVNATGPTAAQAEDTANAVAHSYVAYSGSAKSPFGQVSAQFFQPATTATGTPLSSRLIGAAGPGLLFGVLIGVILALAVGRNDRRLRRRDDIADSIGVPVLASVPVRHLSDAAGWTKLLEDYEPATVDAWHLRKALHQPGLVGVNATDFRADSGSSLAVLSLSSDRKALALGPQLAVFAASLGIPTALVVGPQQDTNVTATLRAACAAPAPPERSRNLQVTVSDDNHIGRLPGAALTVVVAAVDGKNPQVAETMRATSTVLGVSAGAATAEQLARVAASAAADGRDVAGILVADPVSGVPTTGRLPELVRPAQHRRPTRMTGIATETRQ
jgi:capsular polysaccharide biosynthesis protein